VIPTTPRGGDLDIGPQGQCSQFVSVAKLSVRSKNRVSGLDLDLDVDVDGLDQGELSRHGICQIGLYLCMSTSKSTSKSRSRTED
jgi:hypothetical protein